ncbi:hypothetical protein ABW19_dt0205812 [Dactylella cylindrospora]|nr:hypothetical protein ABW19_dt0205812 [Dactylella cylindrospora]
MDITVKRKKGVCMLPEDREWTALSRQGMRRKLILAGCWFSLAPAPAAPISAAGCQLTWSRVLNEFIHSEPSLVQRYALGLDVQNRVCISPLSLQRFEHGGSMLHQQQWNSTFQDKHGRHG